MTMSGETVQTQFYIKKSFKRLITQFPISSAGVRFVCGIWKVLVKVYLLARYIVSAVKKI